MSIISEKDILRKKYRELRQSQDPVELYRKSNEIITKLVGLSETKGPKTIMLYLSYGSEVMTFDVVSLAIQTGMRVVSPYLVGKDMEVSELHDLSEMKNTEYGIIEPMNREPFDKDKIDIIVVPCVVVDVKGNRIGSGLGYYDRYLKDSKALKIALAYDFQVVDKIEPTEEDIPMDIIITEKRIIRCKE